MLWRKMKQLMAFLLAFVVMFSCLVYGGSQAKADNMPDQPEEPKKLSLVFDGDTLEVGSGRGYLPQNGMWVQYGTWNNGGFSEEGMSKFEKIDEIPVFKLDGGLGFGITDTDFVGTGSSNLAVELEYYDSAPSVIAIPYFNYTMARKIWQWEGNCPKMNTSGNVTVQTGGNADAD